MVRILFKMSLIIYFNALGQRTLLLSVNLSLCQSCGQGAGGVVVPGKNKAIGSPRGSLRAPQVGGAKFLEASRSILGCWGPVPEAGPTLLPTSNALLPVAWQGLVRPGDDDTSRLGRGPELWAAFPPPRAPFLRFPLETPPRSTDGSAAVWAESHLPTACLDQRPVESCAGSLSRSPVGPRGPHNHASFPFIIALCLLSW